MDEGQGAGAGAGAGLGGMDVGDSDAVNALLGALDSTDPLGGAGSLF